MLYFVNISFYVVLTRHSVLSYDGFIFNIT